MGLSASKQRSVEADWNYATPSLSTLDVFSTPQSAPQHGPQSMQDCNVCAESKPFLSFPIISVSGQCDHPPQTCLECVATSIRTEFASKRWNQIHCPECRGLMEYEDVEAYADKTTFAK